MKIHKILLLTTVISTGLFSCINDLDTEPIDSKVISSATVFDDPLAYKQFLAKLYGALTLTGQRGEAGLPEISANDEGTTSFLRTYWSAQEVTTDEAINAWGDAGLDEFHSHAWSDNNLYVKLLYQRIFINIAYCNEYIREVSSRVDGLSGDLKGDVEHYLAEARFLRALYYYYAMDLYGNVPFVTEEDGTGAYFPPQIKRADLFAFIEQELLEVIPDMAAPRTNEYARADQAAAWSLLARMYLNAEVYLGAGNKKYTECITYSKKVIDAGYSLHASYAELFMADNDVHRNEMILPVAEDGDYTRNYGGTTYIVHASIGSNAESLGITGGWSGNRPTTTFVNIFDDPSGATDQRAKFSTQDQLSTEINDPAKFQQGYRAMKFSNRTAGGDNGSDLTFVDTDFPIFRLADVYLMYAEAVLRGGTGGDQATALSYVNALRERAYGDDSGNISAAELNLNFILDERGRELYWEGHRRTDLVRYGLFTSDNYTWDWKGGVKSGKGTDSHLNIFPIPFSDRSINTNLEQNDGY
ncbi:RagB/SusD family nutrient uptake outer membrane protein [Fulvivirga ligni]|uniref:RagB/SusD family nutrient uptake outer membrane protein n=1 Tax=Fulvivirga ligni TaxID=2904246 RepID=UPI001F15AE52|nr:RagB/SusD family nutrient uptake outer membrane protein [Fulvivirga ligni]UII21217.1 RagB/SusD family nutrient uptake outer membrane protein [Fulvivirga ligni]